MSLLNRPANMERITTPELANAFIEEQLADLKAQIGDKKVLLALSGGVDRAFDQSHRTKPCLCPCQPRTAA